MIGSFKSQFTGLNESEAKKKLGEHLTEMDLDGDGKVTEQDLSTWIIKQVEKGLMSEEFDEFGLDLVDTDKNKVVTWEEIEDNLRQQSPDAADDVQFKKEKQSAKLKFDHADKNGDKVLSREEYARYSMPDYFSDMTDYSIKQHILGKKLYYYCRTSYSYVILSLGYN